jgi:hypothetical protein
MELRSASPILARLAAHPVDLAATSWAARLRCATGLRHVPSLLKLPSVLRGSRASSAPEPHGAAVGFADPRSSRGSPGRSGRDPVGRSAQVRYRAAPRPATAENRAIRIGMPANTAPPISGRPQTYVGCSGASTPERSEAQEMLVSGRNQMAERRRNTG